MHWAPMVSSFFSTFCSIYLLLGALISPGNLGMAMEEVDSMAVLPLGGSVSGNFFQLPQCGVSRGTNVAQFIGVCYGRVGNNLPDVREIVQLCKRNGIGKMRIYEPNDAMLDALRGSNIEIILGIPNADLQQVAYLSSATDWVQKNIQPYVPHVKFRYIAVGNEVHPTDDRGLQYVLLAAMQSIFGALAAANLQDQIKVSTAIDTSFLGNSFPPSKGSFSVSAFLKPIVDFLNKNGSPLLANVYPYFAYASNPRDLRLDYALFTAPAAVVRDGNLTYHSLFESIVDALYSALEQSGGANVSIVISETGWPSNGSTGATIGNAGTYYKNLISYVQSKSGTPRRPGRAIETYLFAMFDENLKSPEIEKHFGLFTPNKQPKYPLSFS